MGFRVWGQRIKNRPVEVFPGAGRGVLANGRDLVVPLQHPLHRVAVAPDQNKGAKTK